MSITVVDPVCGMEVRPHQNEIIYLGIGYAFCSQQCQQRFLANPHPYVEPTGLPGRPLKSRRMHLASSPTSDQANTLQQHLQQMSGIARVSLDGHYLEITYEPLQITPEQIETKLVEAGLQMGENWEEHLQRAFVHFREECVLGDAAPDERQRH